MPEFLKQAEFSVCVPVYMLGQWWLCSQDVARLLGLSLDSVSVRISSGASMCAICSVRFHGLRLWDAEQVYYLLEKRKKYQQETLF